jgi:hypothetical protein
MVFNVRVNPRASRNLVKKDLKGLKVYLTKPAYEGLANEQLLKLLSEYFKVKRYQVKIIKGEKGRDKHVEVTKPG